jgi:hypothetical protein
MTVALAAAPPGFEGWVEGLPEGATMVRTGNQTTDMVVVFAHTEAEMVDRFRRAMRRIPPEGTIWAAWPKRSSGMPTDITENRLRELLLPTGMVDVKVIAIDQTWSGLKFVVRKERRKAWAP